MLRRWCPTYDELTARTLTGETMSMSYTVAHYGPGIPEDGITTSLAITHPEDACSDITSLTVGPNVTSMVEHPSEIAGVAFLSSIYICHFVNKTIFAEGGDHDARRACFFFARASSRCWQ